MSQIHVLDQATIDRIAAGEVVERPASVVKELVENAIDAGSTRITIEIRDGGKSLIRVTDNGGGIASDEIPLAFTRHATSKLTSAEELMRISSLGFRGEALSSISAVSRVELITKRPDELTASRYLIEGGRERLREEIGAPDGTTIIVRDLFYNTPARAKFLKTAMTEASHVGSYVEQLILSRPDISITLIAGGDTRISSSGNGDLTEAVFRIYGRELTKKLVPLCAERDGIRLAGLIGRPQISRGNRNFEQFFVNGRCIKSAMLSRAVEDGYGTMLMQHQYPFACLMLTLTGEAVDVNVHPTKLEVRFSDEKKVYDSVREAVAGTLRGLDMIVTDNEEEASAAQKLPRPAEPFETQAEKLSESAWAHGPEEEKLQPSDAHTARKEVLPQPAAPFASDTQPATATKLQESLLREEETSYAGSEKIRNEDGARSGRFVQQTFTPRFLSEEAGPARRIVGQVLDTYWICEYEGKVFVFDQHAAHERVLYERFMDAYEKREITQQMQSPPILVTLSAAEEQAYLAHADAFAALGFEIEHFGDHDYAVRAVPYYLGTIAPDVLFHEILDRSDAGTELSDSRLYIRKVATEACKAAVKGGETLSVSEAEKLLGDLLRCEDPYHCPHGRPTILTFSREDIEKRFKRIV